MRHVLPRHHPFVLFESVLKKEQFQNLGQLHQNIFLAALVSMGVTEATIKRIELAMGPALFDTATDRSVLGTLNQSRYEFEYFIADYNNIMEVDTVVVAQWFNHRPLTARGKWLWADEQMLQLLKIFIG